MNKQTLLANKWLVYYLEDPEEDIEGLDWDDFTILIDLKNNEVGEDDRVLAVSPSGEGWMTIAWQDFAQEWNKPLPLEAYRKFMKAVFQEL